VDGQAGDIPFVYFNGKAIITGAEYNPSLLTGNTVPDAIRSIADGTTPLADSVDANAGAIVSDLCQLTDGKPGNVCTTFPKPITR
jgi:hypothetical protein